MRAAAPVEGRLLGRTRVGRALGPLAAAAAARQSGEAVAAQLGTLPDHCDAFLPRAGGRDGDDAGRVRLVAGAQPERP